MNNPRQEVFDTATTNAGALEGKVSDILEAANKEFAASGIDRNNLSDDDMLVLHEIYYGTPKRAAATKMGTGISLHPLPEHAALPETHSAPSTTPSVEPQGSTETHSALGTQYPATGSLLERASTLFKNYFVPTKPGH